METTFSNKCNILSELWIKYRNEEKLADFFDYNDISLPLAFMISEGVITERNVIIEGFIEEAFIVFLAAIKIEDQGFDNLDEVLVEYLEDDFDN